MSWTTRLSRGAAALALSFTALAAQAGPYSNMYVFGDSLSDSGNDLKIVGDVPAPDYYTDGPNRGRFTNGLNYADRLAANFGLTLTPSELGGNNYAYGGARSEYVRDDLLPFGGLSFNEQIDAYLRKSGHAADPNALYVLWIGANDMSDAAVTSLMMGGNLAPIGGQIVQTIGDPTKIGDPTAPGDILSALLTLQTLGARNFLIGNSPDLSLTPAARGLAAYFGSGVSELFQGASVGFNQTLAAMLPFYTLPTSSVTLFDAFALQTAMTDNPAAYGLTNVTGACYDGQIDGSPAPGSATANECPNEGEYLYYDTEHPSAVLHEWAARTIYAQLVVPEPGELALSLTALGLMGLAGRRSRRG